ncbi:hypothetical protein D7S86_24280 [Pararobbsia silviterrae]|uniref:Uncharacterized protein n=2 Tax=Pararobbsia silviterrae TaxID=1792498 RepID=A0A494XDS5_9BURK|nr:hypothetical protein D7S86_24280 [Pararobbsia silviterrae]
MPGVGALSAVTRYAPAIRAVSSAIDAAPRIRSGPGASAGSISLGSQSNRAPSCADVLDDVDLFDDVDDIDDIDDDVVADPDRIPVKDA